MKQKDLTLNGRTYPPKVVLICGSRFWDRPLWVWFIVAAIKRRYGDNTIIIHGGARGVDRAAGMAAKALGLQVREHKADWRYGPSAGVARNVEMFEAEKPSLVIAVGDGRGTNHMARYARDHGAVVQRRYMYANIDWS